MAPEPRKRCQPNPSSDQQKARAVARGKGRSTVRPLKPKGGWRTRHDALGPGPTSHVLHQEAQSVLILSGHRVWVPRTAPGCSQQVPYASSEFAPTPPWHLQQDGIAVNLSTAELLGLQNPERPAPPKPPCQQSRGVKQKGKHCQGQKGKAVQPPGHKHRDGEGLVRAQEDAVASPPGRPDAQTEQREAADACNGAKEVAKAPGLRLD
mmetsp:Transcript_7232/g.22079  ORF Transcript_7232/g.22079 Transcript_7232/m.22079 type:complete len:208 (-) Transcript_7232:603-1226(-)